jgi:DNA-binding response OmpR family regulator
VALIVDDDPSSRMIARLALRGEFATILELPDGVQALDRISIEVPDLLVIDQMMPGLTGVDVIRVLRSRLETAALPVIMLTAVQGDAMESVSLDAGADDYLEKPVTPERLRARVTSLLRSRLRLAASQ